VGRRVPRPPSPFRHRRATRARLTLHGRGFVRHDRAGMRLLRTPDERFAALPDFPFAAQYTEIDDGDGGRMRSHRVDEGLRDAGETVLLLHGEPSWSYHYRTMVPVITAA